MKLKSLVIIGLSVIPVLSFADMSFNDDNATNPFAGLFVGVGAGYNHTQVKYSFPSTGSSDTLSKNAALGQALLGYNYGIDANWLIGAELSFTYDSAKISETVHSGVTSTEKMPQVYGIDGLLGYAFSPSIMAFLGAGGATSNLKTSTSSGSYSSSENFIGWKALAGAQQGLVSGLSVRETVSYTDYMSKNIHISSVEHKVQPSNYGAVVSLIYTFNI